MYKLKALYRPNRPGFWFFHKFFILIFVFSVFCTLGKTFAHDRSFCKPICGSKSSVNGQCPDGIMPERPHIEKAFADTLNCICKRDFVGLKKHLEDVKSYKLSNGDSFIDALLKDFCNSLFGKKTRFDKFEDIDIRSYKEPFVFGVVIFLVNSGADCNIAIGALNIYFENSLSFESFPDLASGALVLFFAKEGLFDSSDIGNKFMHVFIEHANKNKFKRCMPAFLKIIFDKGLFKSSEKDQKLLSQLIESAFKNSVQDNNKFELLILIGIISGSDNLRNYEKFLINFIDTLIEDKKIELLKAISDSCVKIPESEIKKIDKFLGKYQKTNPVVEHAKVLKELKDKFRNKKKRDRLKSGKVIESPSATQTESFLKVWFDLDKNAENVDYEVLLERMIKEEYLKVISDQASILFGKNLQDYIGLTKAMLSRERRHKDCYVFYHANNASSQIVFDIQTAIAKWFKLKNLRSKDIYLRYKKVVEHEDIKGFMQDYEKEFYKNSWPDGVEPMRSQVLSVNLSLFGNTRCDGECSLFYFINGISISDPSEILREMFGQLGLPIDYIEKIKLLYQTHIEKAPLDFTDLVDQGLIPRLGNMLQIFIPKINVDKFAYLSAAGGRPIESKIVGFDYDAEKKRNVSLAQFLEKYISDPCSLKIDGQPSPAEWFIPFDAVKQPKDIMNFFQARIVFMPDFYDKSSGIKIVKYNFASKHEKKKYKRELDKIINQMMGQWLDQKGYEKVAENDGNRKFLRLVKYINSGKEFCEQNNI